MRRDRGASRCCASNDGTGLADLLTCFRYPNLEDRNAARTTDEIDKSFVLNGGMVVWHGRPPRGA